MSKQINTTEQLPPLTNLEQRQKITVADARLQKIQWRFGLAAVFIPFLGTIVAIGLLSRSTLSPVALGLLVSMYALTMIGITVGFHRHFAHCAFQTNTPIRIILAILGSMAAQGHIIHWVSNHRRHHQCSDQPGDPHSPHLQADNRWSLLRGLWHAQVGWMFESDFPNVLFAKDLLRDSIIVKVNSFYLIWVILGLAIPTVLGGILTWTWQGAGQGFLWGGLVRVFLVHHATWSINSICHVYGSHPFHTGEQSRNNIWLAIPTAGESWHNNHHAFPNSAIHGLEWWQIDLSAWVIRFLEKTNLAWDVKVPTAGMIESKKRANLA